ncbi:MAG: sugar ABC transporter permease [Pelagibacteraceae bacterium]|jgi:sn-glycerol 3-phosphate transport system permease protein|nr:sugar ABC transporter permease [Pelagibacteraceae bacterium]MBO6467136.1 sugar ABC transporter permease [Pelagibacteraceae bacterium]MBO6470637.1 sugar ABC transporter permease [Pelagibacteraceae bacterium]MBO6471294.1 sugar ABC transporter permease [Pelagibacteraceae bacterium]|tara:strand:+ start:5738 stop:6613 length:876 start_codon:yes stop_codon:yes gene_type:complete
MNKKLNLIYVTLLLTPGFILLISFTHIPAVKTIIFSFFSTPRGKRPTKFVGLENYDTLINDPVFWKVISNNLWYAFGTIPSSIILSLIMALWVNSKIIGRPFLRFSFFMPTILPLIAVGNIWLFFYTPGFGLIDQIRSFFNLPNLNLLGSEDTALWAVMIVSIWKEAGFFMIFYLAGLQAIPPSLREAAMIEGASNWYIFRKITFPLLMPTTLFISVNAVINSFRLVDHIVIMTEGGPDNASNLLLYYIYEVAFYFWDTAYGSTLTVVLIFLLSLLAIGQFFFLDRKVHYQ